MTKPGRFHIQMFSIHGLVRSQNLELGYDADTGGQIKYLIELCRTLSKSSSIHKVDLFTRLIDDKSFSDDYACPVEPVNDKFRIIRIQCGGKKYIRKELLWPHLDEFIDKTIKFIRQEGQIPNVFHGHYPDAGYVASELAGFFGSPMVYTGHSLGRSKKRRLLEQGIRIEEINRRIKIDYRINMEERILKAADMVVTSTNQEIEGQYGQYRNRTIPRYTVIPPGIDIDRFYPYYHSDFENDSKKEETLFYKASVTNELEIFLQHMDRPLILSLCRPDKRKNIQGLVKAFGEDPELQAMANLAIFAGIRKDIAQKEENERDVLTQMLLLMDKYNLYGKMAIPKQHEFEHEVPELYRIAAEKRGVFVNPALTEPFGLTLLEALACGLPVVATNDGGPRDIINNCKTGILVNPSDTKAIALSIKKILVDADRWNRFSKNGILNTRKFYTWESHVQSYCKKLEELYEGWEDSPVEIRKPRYPIGERLTSLSHLLVTDIDNTFLGGDKKEVGALRHLLEKYKGRIGFAVATGRVFDSAMAVLRAHSIPVPDIVISNVGTRISYGDTHLRDKGWETHISKNWQPGLIRTRLGEIDFIRLQEAEVQSEYKISYFMEPGKDRLNKIHHVLTKNRLKYTLIYSQNRHIDILPYRASKGKAIRYISYKWGIPLNNILVCGDSGNDAEMLKGELLGVVVGNYSPELEGLKSLKKIYFSDKPYAGGILDGLAHYRYIEKIKDLEK